jgi:hypothetical protein
MLLCVLHQDCPKFQLFNATRLAVITGALTLFSGKSADSCLLTHLTNQLCAGEFVAFELPALQSVGSDVNICKRLASRVRPAVCAHSHADSLSSPLASRRRQQL